MNNKVKSFFVGKESNSFFKTYRLINQLIWLDPRTYLLNIALPFPIVFCVFYFWFNFITSTFSPANLLALFMIPIVFNFLFFSFNELVWKKTIMFARLKNAGTSKQILISVLIISFAQIAVISLLFSAISTIVVVKIISGYHQPTIGVFIFDDCQNEFTPYSYIMTTLTYLFTIIFFGFASITLPFVIKNQHFAKLFIIILFIFFLSTSDSLIDSNISTSILPMQILGYFNIFKYFVWTILTINCYGNMDSIGYQQIIAPYNGFNPFPSIVIPVMVTLVATCLIFLLSLKITNWERK